MWQEGMELQGQGRGLCISFSWLVNDKTLIGRAPFCQHCSVSQHT